MSGSVAPKKNKGKEINEFGMRPERDTPEYAKAYKKSSSPKPDPKRKYGTSSQGDKSSRKKSPVSDDLITLIGPADLNFSVRVVALRHNRRHRLSHSPAAMIGRFSNEV